MLILFLNTYFSNVLLFILQELINLVLKKFKMLLLNVHNIYTKYKYFIYILFVE